MSDSTNSAGDVSRMNLDELRSEYDELTDRINTLSGASDIETVEARNVLRVRRNEVATAHRALKAASSAEIEDAEIDDDADAAVDAVAETTDTVEDAVENADTDSADAVVAEAEAVVADAAATVENAGDTADTQDVITPTNGGTPVDNTPTPEPTADSVVAEAEAIANEATFAGSGVTASVGSRPAGDATIERPTAGFIAKGGQSTFNEGTALDFGQIGTAISDIQSAGRTSGAGIVASLPAFEVTPGLSEQTLTSRMSATDATAFIAETVKNHRAFRSQSAAGQVDAVTASICTPLDIIREVPECGVTDTPLSDILPQRPISRLGFQYFPQMALTDTAAGVNVWSDSDQDAVDEGNAETWKPAVMIECLPAVSVVAEELVAAALVDNSTQISQPEQVIQFIHKLSVMRARKREQYIAGKIDALSSAYSLTADYGALTSLFHTVGELMPQLAYGERVSTGDYDLVLEPGHMAKLIMDEDARVYGDSFASRRAGIVNKLKDDYGVGNVVEMLDLRTGASFTALNDPGDAAVAMPHLFDVNRVRFVPTEAFIFGATGEDSTGWESDPQLNRQNLMQWFSKEWLLVAKHGCHASAYVDLLSCGNGARAAGIEPVDCTGQAS